MKWYCLILDSRKQNYNLKTNQFNYNTCSSVESTWINTFRGIVDIFDVLFGKLVIKNKISNEIQRFMKNLMKIFTKISQILNKSELFDNNASIFNSKIKDNMKRRWWYTELSICRWIRRARQMYFAICRDSWYVNEACCVSGNTQQDSNTDLQNIMFMCLHF